MREKTSARRYPFATPCDNYHIQQLSCSQGLKRQEQGKEQS